MQAHKPRKNGVIGDVNPYPRSQDGQSASREVIHLKAHFHTTSYTHNVKHREHLPAQATHKQSIIPEAEGHGRCRLLYDVWSLLVAKVWINWVRLPILLAVS